MKALHKTALLAAGVGLLAVGGCASSGGYIPVTSDVINAQGEHVVKLGGYTKDASVARTAEVQNTLRWRDQMYQKAHSESGFELEFAMVEVGATQAYLPKKITFREAPNFEQELPTAPAPHPVWATTKSIVNNIADKTLIGWGISEGTSFLKTAFSSAGTTYNGPVRMSNSLNSAQGDQQFSVADQYDGNVEFVAPEEPEGEEVAE